MNCALIFDGIEFLDHLGQSPGSQGSQDHNAKQVQRIRSEEGGKSAGLGCCRGILHHGEGAYRGEKAPIGFQYGGDHGADAKKHDQSLDKVVDGCCHIASGNHIDAGQHCHQYDADRIINVKCHAEETGEPVVEGSRIGDQEDKDDNGGADL